jgi:hypothetical protein
MNVPIAVAVQPDSRLRDDDQRARLSQDSLHAARERAWVERAEAFVEDDELGSPEQRTSQKESGAFAVRELPACFTDDLMKAGGHAADRFALCSLEAMRHVPRRRQRHSGATVVAQARGRMEELPTRLHATLAPPTVITAAVSAPSAP